MVAMGLGFQVPVAILAACGSGSPRPEKLRKNRRYAILVIAVVAAFLPTIDPVTLILEMVPLIMLYELSILLASRDSAGPGPRRPSRHAAEGPEPASLPARAVRPPRQAPPRGAGHLSHARAADGRGTRVLRHRRRRVGRALRRLLRAWRRRRQRRASRSASRERGEAPAHPAERGCAQGAGARLLPARHRSEAQSAGSSPTRPRTSCASAAGNWQRYLDVEKGIDASLALVALHIYDVGALNSPRRPRRRRH